MTRSLALLLVLSLLAPLGAHAQVVAILPPKLEPEVAPPEARTAIERIAAHLRRQGLDVLEPAAAQAKLPRRLRDCAEPACAREALEPLHADLALLLSVFASAEPSAPNVSLELVDRAGVSYTGTASGHSGKPSLLAAVDDALARQRRGPGPWLTVQGEPNGAEVVINGKGVGTLPRYTGRVDPGTAHVLVREPGYQELNQLVDVGSSLDGSKVVDVSLAPEALPSLSAPIGLRGASPTARTTRDADDTETARSERKATATDYGLGLAFALGGLALATIDPVRTALKDGDCVDRSCRELYSFSTRSTLEVAGGAALLATGMAIAFWWKPFSVRISAGERTSIALQTRF